jgi:hypothetical protein
MQSSYKASVRSIRRHIFFPNKFDHPQKESKQTRHEGGGLTSRTSATGRQNSPTTKTQARKSMSIRVSEVLYIVIGFSIMLINTSESSNSSLGDPTVTPTVTI